MHVQISRAGERKKAGNRDETQITFVIFDCIC